MNAAIPSTSAERAPRATARWALVLGALGGAGLAVIGLRHPEASVVGDRSVIATVNGTEIRRDDFGRSIEAVAGDRRNSLSDDDRREILERMIDEELLVQRGLELGLARSDRKIRADLVSAVMAPVVAESEEVELTEDELRAYFDAHTELFAEEDRVRMRQVFVAVPVDADEAAQHVRVTEAARLLREGAAFDDVQERFGDVQAVSLPNALLPAAKVRDYLGPTVTRSAFALEAGEVSEPVRSASGWHVVQILERQGGNAPTFEEMRERIQAAARRQAGETAMRRYLDELRDGARITRAEKLE